MVTVPCLSPLSDAFKFLINEILIRIIDMSITAGFIGVMDG